MDGTAVFGRRCSRGVMLAFLLPRVANAPAISTDPTLLPHLARRQAKAAAVALFHAVSSPPHRPQSTPPTPGTSLTPSQHPPRLAAPLYAFHNASTTRALSLSVRSAAFHAPASLTPPACGWRLHTEISMPGNTFPLRGSAVSLVQSPRNLRLRDCSGYRFVVRPSRQSGDSHSRGYHEIRRRQLCHSH